MRSIYDIRVTPTPYTYLKYVNQMCVSTYFLFLLCFLFKVEDQMLRNF